MLPGKRRASSAEDSDCGASSSSRVAEVSESPKKRTRCDSDSRSASANVLPQPETPVKLKPRWTSMSSPGKRPRTPYTPHTPYTPYPLRAMDSPSNPFGRKRRERLVHTLPPVSSFSKHICLRFQFIRGDISPRLGGVYRVVRVPLSYTFAHLRCLINWLFETPARLSNGKQKLKGTDEEKEEYLFEVMNKADTYSMMYKPGQLKTGATAVKLSNVQDPGGWPADHVFPADGDGDEDDADGKPEDESEQDWEWMDEEEYTLAHVWQNGLDPTIAIVYHHSSDTQVHITINTTKLPVKRGISNTPEVFLARGRVHLRPWPVVTKPSPKSKRTKREPASEEQLTDTDAEGDTDEEQQVFSESHPYFHASSPAKVLVEDTDCENDDDNDNDNDHEAQPEDFTLTREPSRWNTPAHAFPLYLLKFMDPLGISFADIDASFFEEEETPYDPFDRDDDDDAVDGEDEEEEVYTKRVRAASRGSTVVYSDVEDDDEDDAERTHATLGSTPGLSYGFSSSSSLPPSSSPGPGRASSPSLFHWGNSSSMSLPDLGAEIVLEEHYPNKKYAATPAPPKGGAHRLRLKRIERRLERIKKAAFLCARDEEKPKPVVQAGCEGDGHVNVMSAREGAKKGRGRGHVVSNPHAKPRVKKALVDRDL